MKKQYYLLFILSFVFIFSSCKKYDDGPVVSLLTKTARLTGEWDVEEIDGEYLTDVSAFITFEKNGDFELSVQFNDYYYDDYIERGYWEWESGKESVDVTVDGERQEYKILRLTNDELWFEDEEREEWRCTKN